MTIRADKMRHALALYEEALRAIDEIEWSDVDFDTSCMLRKAHERAWDGHTELRGALSLQETLDLQEAREAD